jgi:UDP-GlcNAc:undecaprenyl-phosphate GlcNAc-1-phosphate transferase
MFLGFVLAATSLRGATTKSSTAVAILAPMVALGVPIFDTMLAMIRRTLARQPIFSADRGHIHHRLLDLGLTHRRVVLVLYTSSILLALAAIGIAFGRSWQIGAALVLAGGVLFTLVRAAGAVQRANRPLGGDADRAAALQSMQKRVASAIAALKRCSDEVSIERVLIELASDRRMLRNISLRSMGLAGTFVRSSHAPAELRYAVEAGTEAEHVLEVTLNPRLAPLMREAGPLFAGVAAACAEALARGAARKSQPQLLVAQ